MEKKIRKLIDLPVSVVEEIKKEAEADGRKVKNHIEHILKARFQAKKKR